MSHVDLPGTATLASRPLVIGLDGEMSSPDLDRGGRLIQAGFAVRAPGTTDVISEVISWPEMLWEERAAEVHGLSRDQVDAAPPAGDVDANTAAWLARHGATPGRRDIISVGFNVGAFDHPFFRESLPITMSSISRRVIDLNGVCMTLDGWDPNPRNEPRDWRGWKRSSKKAAAQHLADMGVDGREHDAGYDAALALIAWLWMREQVRSAHAVVRP